MSFLWLEDTNSVNGTEWLEQGLTLVLNDAILHLYLKTLFLNLVSLCPHSLFLFFTWYLPKSTYSLDNYTQGWKDSPDIILLKPDFRTSGSQSMESAAHSATELSH